MSGEAGPDAQLWGGRFGGPPAPEAWRLLRSLDVDIRLAPHDVRVSRAHASGLAEAGILSIEEREAIHGALDDIAREIEVGTFVTRESDEDVHGAIERALTERLGGAGAKIHAGRSRNDQVVAGTRLFVKDACATAGAGIRRVVSALVAQAAEKVDVLAPGYTHLQRAQPVLFAHHLLAHAWALVRDEVRFSAAARAADVSPLGAAALAGTTVPLLAGDIARELGFSRTFDNSIDAVSDRDFALEYLAAAAILGVHVSRLSEELVMWSSAEFGFVQVDEAYATGSSIMPQKRNPDVAELSRGKSGRLLGAFVTLSTVLKGLPLAYDRDMQEDKEPVFDAADTLDAVLPALAGMIETLHIRGERLEALARDPSLLATDLAERLAIGGMPFREAHRLVGRTIAEAEREGRAMDAIDWTEVSPILAGMPPLDADRAVTGRDGPGATSRLSVEHQLEQLSAWLAG